MTVKLFQDLICTDQQFARHIHDYFLLPVERRTIIVHLLHPGPYPLLGTVVRQTDFDLTIRQGIVSDRNLACAGLHQTQDTVRR